MVTVIALLYLASVVVLTVAATLDTRWDRVKAVALGMALFVAAHGAVDAAVALFK